MKSVDEYARQREILKEVLLAKYYEKHPDKQKKKKPRKHVFFSTYAILTFWD